MDMDMYKLKSDELIAAIKELDFQNDERESRAAELKIANAELIFQNGEKEKRAAELIIANEELVFQNGEKEKRGAELVIANEELVYQNAEKEKRAAELIIANEELVYQNGEKEKRAAELVVANNELLFQNGEKEKRAAELILANKELTAFNYVASHDLLEPLRKIQVFASIITQKELDNLSDSGKEHFLRIQAAAVRMQMLIEDLLTYSRTNATERKFEPTDLGHLIDEVKNDLKYPIEESGAIIEVACPETVSVIRFQFRQLMNNLLGNAIKFSFPGIPPRIAINCEIVSGNTLKGKPIINTQKEYCHISVKDNGIGFEPEYSERIFNVFQKLHSKEQYEGTGIGLAIVKKIVENHSGFITVTSELSKGATFDIYIPVSQ